MFYDKVARRKGWIGRLVGMNDFPPHRVVSFQMNSQVHSHWTPKQRILVFAPPVAFTLLSIAVLAVFWPKDAELSAKIARASISSHKMKN